MNRRYQRFALGLRVVDEKNHGISPEHFFNMLFQSLSAEEMAERDLYVASIPEGVCDPERVYIVIIANMPLKESKRFFQRIQRDIALTSYLSIYRPFVQNNYLDKCRDRQYVGRVGADGRVTGGDIAIGSMHFSAPRPREALVIRLRFLLSPLAYPGLTPAQATRCLTRAVASRFPDAIVEPFPLSDGGIGTLDAFLYHRGGRYVPCRAHDMKGNTITVNYGILSDYSAVIEAAQIRSAADEEDGNGEAQFSGSFGVGELLLHALTAKCRRIYLCVDPKTLSDHGDGFMRALGMQMTQDSARMLVDADLVHPNLKETTLVVLSDITPDGKDATGVAKLLTPFAHVEEASTVETLLQQGSFHCKLREMTLVFSGIGDNDPDGRAQEHAMGRIGAHCKKALKQLVDIRIPHAYDESEAEQEFFQAALDAIARMKFENWFIAWTAEIVPISGEKRKEKR